MPLDANNPCRAALLSRHGGSGEPTCKAILAAGALTLLVVAALVLCLQGSLAAQPKPGHGKDYSKELPRVPPREPTEAQKTFRLRPGFRIELVAAEPLIRSPVALDFDEDGRMYVVEFPEYNQYANPKFKGHGSVKLLEDTDDDGRYDKATVFADNLDSPVAVACYDGGVFVGVVPDVLFLKDTDGDGEADVRRAVLTGFARDAAGEAMLNSFRWSLDNRFRISTSLAGGSVRRADRKDDRPVNVRGQHLLFDPRGGSFDLSSGGGQHGMTLDDWGRAFVSENSNPIHFLAYDARYLARNPFTEAPAPAVNIAPEGKYTKLFRISPNEPWRVLRTRLRTEGVVPGSDEGGKPSGFFTGATGVTAYRGDAWPDEYRGNLLVGEVANNLMYRARLEPKGVGFVAQRADEPAEFLASTDNWFRPVQFANGPDGCLYVIDMYRELIEGAAFLPPEILRHMDVSSGIDRGRVWRIVPEDFKRRSTPHLGRATTTELVALLEHKNGWHRDTAARLLYQRQDRAAVGPLKKLASASRFALGRLHALYALLGMGALDVTVLLPALEDSDARLREHAVRLAERFEASPLVRAKLEKLTDDSDARVRYQLAFTLGSIGGEMPGRALAKLALADAADPWVRVAILSSLQARAGEVFGRLCREKTFRSSDYGRAFLSALAVQIGAANQRGDVAAVVKAIDELPNAEAPLAREIVRSLVSKLPVAGREHLSGAAGGKAPAILADLLGDARRTFEDDKRSPEDRAAALRALGLAKFADVKGFLAAALELRQPGPVQQAALETLGRFDDAEVPRLVLAAWPGLSPRLRATAAETLFSRPAWVAAFLDAVEKGTIRPGDIDPARVALLEASADPRLRDRAVKLFAAARLGKRPDVVAAYRKALEIKGDPKKGKTLFKQHCSACHRLEGVGEAIGADLAAIRDRGLEAVLLNVLDPNREVKPQYVTYSLETTSGRVIAGMITAETTNSITLRRPDSTSETVPRRDIAELRSTGLSFMPEGLEKLIDVPAMADLLAYLGSIR